MINFETMMAANKAQLENFAKITEKAFSGVERMIEMNMQAAKSALEDASETAQKMASVKDAQEFMTTQAAMIQPLLEKTTAYSRQLYSVASAAGDELSKNIEAQAADSKTKFMDFVDTASKNAPVGTEPVVAMAKKVVEVTNAAVEATRKTVKQATSNMEKSFKATAENAKDAKKR